MKRWRKIIYTNAEGATDTYVLYGSKRKARQFIKEMIGLGYWMYVYHIITNKECVRYE